MIHPITILGLGPGPKELLTLGAAEALRKAKAILLRTGRHGAAHWLQEQGIPFTTLDDLYDQSPDFDAFAQEAVSRVKAMAQEGPLCYGVADPGQDSTVDLLRAEEGLPIRVMAGVPLAAPLSAAVAHPRPYMVSEAAGLRVDGGDQPLCLTEINTKELAGQCKLLLLEHYDPDTPLYFFPPSRRAERDFTKITLEDLDRQPRYDHSAAALLLPKTGFYKDRYGMRDLIRIMRKLRAPDGCPWDREQTHLSLARYLSEEAAEAVHAIHQQDWLAAADELGDVLLQVVFHAVVGEEQGSMSLSDITSAICGKLVSRHRHIFGGDKLSSAQQVADAWEKIKAEERGQQTPAEKMRALPLSLPPVLRALKVQQIAAKQGFDWPDAREALKKVHEEAEELLSDYDAGKDTAPEMGDLFTACINTARLMGLYPDEVVDITTEKFIKRYEYMENAMKIEGKQAKGLTLHEWDVYWSRSKQAE